MKCSIVYPGQYVAWVTCMLSDYETQILGGMVKKGYTVSPAAQSGVVTLGTPNAPAVVVCFRIDSSKEDITASDVMKDLMDLLNEKKFLYYSVIVSALAGSTWNTSNISLPKKDPAPAVPEAPPTPKSNLN